MNFNRRNLIGTIASSLLIGETAFAQNVQTPQFAISFQNSMREIEVASGGRLGVAFLITNSPLGSRMLNYRGLERFPMCSTFKFVLAGFILQMQDEGRLSIDKQIEIAPSDIVSYSPICEANIGKTLSLSQLCEATITRSDNAAANILLRELGGVEAFNRRLPLLWDNTTRLDRFEPDLNSAVPNDDRDTTSPSAMVMNLRRFLMPRANRTFLLPQSQIILRNWLIANQTGGASLKKYMPENWVIGDKTGAGENNTVNDVAFIEKPNGEIYYIAAYLTGAKDEFPQNKKNLADIGKYIVANF